MKTRFPILLMLAALGLAGCAATPVTRTPPDAAQRAGFGRMGIVALSPAAGISIQAPEEKADAAAACALKLGFTPLLDYGHSSGMGCDPFTSMLVVGWIPVGIVVGGTYGATRGMTEKSLQDNFTRLTSVTAGRSFEEELSRRVRGRAAQRGWPLTAQPVPADPTRTAGPRATGQNVEMDYRNLQDRGITTVLEIKTYSPGLEGREGVNPPMHFAVDIRLRLIATADGREQYYDYLEYRSDKLPFTTWATDDARKFRSELEASLDCVSEEIVEQIFTRVSASEPVNTAHLSRK